MYSLAWLRGLIKSMHSWARKIGGLDPKFNFLPCLPLQYKGAGLQGAAQMLCSALDWAGFFNPCLQHSWQSQVLLSYGFLWQKMAKMRPACQAGFWLEGLVLMMGLQWPNLTFLSLELALKKSLHPKSLTFTEVAKKTKCTVVFCLGTL